MKINLLAIFLCINNGTISTSFTESDLDNEIQEIIYVDKEKEEYEQNCCYECLFFFTEMYERLIDPKDIDKKAI